MLFGYHLQPGGAPSKDALNVDLNDCLEAGERAKGIKVHRVKSYAHPDQDQFPLKDARREALAGRAKEYAVGVEGGSAPQPAIADEEAGAGADSSAAPPPGDAPPPAGPPAVHGPRAVPIGPPWSAGGRARQGFPWRGRVTSFHTAGRPWLRLYNPRGCRPAKWPRRGRPAGPCPHWL